jgi:hypothetical protein
MAGPDQFAGTDMEAALEARRQHRLQWARGSSAGWWAPDPEPARPAADRAAEAAPSLSGPDWTVDVDLIERRRIVRGWSRQQLAAAAHVDPKTLRDLLGRRRRPNLGTVQVVSRALELSLTDVITFPRGAARTPS